MFTQEWRQHWKLDRDPFSSEDADKDAVLADVDAGAVHSGFDRIFGDPRMPAPGIAFGEKGSGKSALRLMMRRRIDTHNQEHDKARVFLLEYIDFNPYLEHFRSRSDSIDAITQWTIADHIDCLLSLGTTKLVDLLLNEKASHEKLLPKQKINFALLAALYDNSNRRTTADATKRVRSSLGAHLMRSFWMGAGTLLASAACILAGAMPHLTDDWPGKKSTWYAIAIGGLVLVWLARLFGQMRVARTARRAAQSLRVLPRDSGPLADLLRALPPQMRKEFPLPDGNHENARYQLLDRLMDLTRSFGYRGWYVLVDRVDEPTLLSGDAEAMSSFVQKLLDIKLLQYPHLALKLFLPIELENLHRSAGKEGLKSMRLDKSNLIAELKWSGQELLDIANERLAASVEPGSELKHLEQLFAEDFDIEHLKSTLDVLGTPRYCFSFLAAVILDHVKDLEADLGQDDPRWRIPRSVFDVARAGWIDRTGAMRRALN